MKTVKKIMKIPSVVGHLKKVKTNMQRVLKTQDRRHLINSGF